MNFSLFNVLSHLSARKVIYELKDRARYKRILCRFSLTEALILRRIRFLYFPPAVLAGGTNDGSIFVAFGTPHFLPPFFFKIFLLAENSRLSQPMLEDFSEEKNKNCLNLYSSPRSIFVFQGFSLHNSLIYYRALKDRLKDDLFVVGIDVLNH